MTQVELFPKPQLIALYSSRAQSGKSTAAEYLRYRHGFEVVKFAAPLKEMTRELLKASGIEDHAVERYVDGDLKEEVIPELGTTSRYIQQTLGTDWGRETIKGSLWVDIAVSRAFYLMRKKNRSVVIDDLRFPNEYETIRQISGKIVALRRGRTGTNTAKSQYEGLLDGCQFDSVIDNNSSLGYLHACLDGAVSRHVGN